MQLALASLPTPLGVVAYLRLAIAPMSQAEPRHDVGGIDMIVNAGS